MKSQQILTKPKWKKTVKIIATDSDPTPSDFFIFLEPKHSDDLKKPRFLRDKGTGCDLM